MVKLNDMAEAERNPKAFTPPKEHLIYRIQYTKGEEVRFIGHLDVMRLFQRAIKRAGLPVAYSKGFNPHQLISFASPLTLGATSEGEYGDFEMIEKIEPAYLMEALNLEMPLGMRVTDAVLLIGRQPTAMAATCAAKYHVTLYDTVDSEMIKKSIPGFLAQKEIVVLKKTKSKEEQTNIRDDIYELKYVEDNCQKPMLYLFLAAGSIRNLKPEPVIRSLYEFIGQPFSPYQMRVHKLQLFHNREDKMVSLMEGIGVRCLNEIEVDV